MFVSLYVINIHVCIAICDQHSCLILSSWTVSDSVCVLVDAMLRYGVTHDTQMTRRPVAPAGAPISINRSSWRYVCWCGEGKVQSLCDIVVENL